MRLMVVGPPGGRLTRAAKLAEQSGADVVHADGVMDALNQLSAGGRADVVLIDAALAIGDFEKGLRINQRPLPVIACGPSADACVARHAIHAGANEYLPLPSGVQDIAALIAALAGDDRALTQQVGAASSMH